MAKCRKKFFNIFSGAERAKHFLITQYYSLKALIAFHAMVFKNRHSVGISLMRLRRIEISFITMDSI